MNARRAGVISLLICLVVVYAGCGAKTDTTPTTTGSKDPTEQQSTTAPAELGRPLDTTAPERSIRELVSLLRANAVPGAALLYDPRLDRAVGRGLLVAALRQVQASYVQLKLAVTDIRRTSPGVIVSVRRSAPKGPPILGSYIVHKVGAKWLIVYDSFVSDAVLTVSISREQRRLNPRSQRPSQSAISAGRAMQQRFDAVAGR